MSYTILGIYRPPSTKNAFFEQLKALLRECDFDSEIIILGDFNINWENKTDRKSLKQLADTLQLVKGLTRITSANQSYI